MFGLFAHLNIRCDSASKTVSVPSIDFSIFKLEFTIDDNISNFNKILGILKI